MPTQLGAALPRPSERTHPCGRRPMKRLLCVSLVVLPVLVSKAAVARTGICASDVDSYLQSKGSHMVGEGGHYVKWGQFWNVDPRVVIALSGAESSWGNS